MTINLIIVVNVAAFMNLLAALLLFLHRFEIQLIALLHARIIRFSVTKIATFAVMSRKY